MKVKYLNLFLISILFLLSCDTKQQVLTEAGKDWPVYLGGNSAAQYSPLDQINIENVDQLQVAWEFHTGDVEKNDNTQIQCNAIIIDGTLYGSSPKLKIFALDAASGEKRWMYDPNAKVDFGMNVNRGVSYWRDGDDERILFTAGSELFCLDARTGQLVQSFGTNGRTSLKKGLGEEAKDLFVVSTSPGAIFKDKIIIGTRVSENSDAAPGFVQAFNVRNGDLEWTFHTIPDPGEFGYESWPADAYKNIGGANAWAGMSLDEGRGIVYVPTGSASFDFWGGNRNGDNLFANCVLALNAETGERIWHFQTVHHDLWDRDIPTPPTLVTVKHKGKNIDAAAQITKSGFVFLLDRETGESLFPIEERKVPQSDLKGEKASLTQPFPVKPPPFTRQKFTQEDITDLSEEAHDYVAERLAKLRTGQPFIPPSTEGSVVFPGFDGGGGWGGAAFDPNSGLLYVNAKEVPTIITMEEIQTPKANEVIDLGKSVYLTTCAMCHGKKGEGDASGTYPALTGLSGRYSEDEVLNIINKGRGGLMPGFEHISLEKRTALVNYLYGVENKPLDVHELGAESNQRASLYTHTGYNRFYDHEGYPAIKPPWGTLTAIDLNEGIIQWQVPLGEFEELTKRGIPKTGTQNYGGPVVTSGGLVFIGATVDEYFRAFDKETGEELWKYKLPAAGYATPSVYQVAGKQYVVIACGGGKGGTKSGDYYIAFALPDATN